jgi:hypothetical protein
MQSKLFLLDAERPVLATESKKRAISLAINTRRACNEERHSNAQIS